MNGWWPYILLVIVLAAPVVGVILRSRVVRRRADTVASRRANTAEESAAGPGQS